MSSYIINGCDINLEGKELTIDLVTLIIQHFDVILGMDWLSVNHAIIDCENMRVMFQVPNLDPFHFQGKGVVSPPYLVTVVKACHSLKNRCSGYLCSIVDTHDTRV